MIRITYLSNAKLKKGELDNLDKLRSEVLIDCIAPERADLKKLSRKTDIPYDDFVRALDEDERPGISEFDTFSRITFHAPVHVKAKAFVTVPFSIFIKRNYTIILRNTHIDCIDKFEITDPDKRVEILTKDNAFTIYSILNEVVNHFFKAVEDLETKITKIDKKVITSEDEKLVKEIFHIKKTLIFFHKSLIGNREVVVDLEKQLLRDIHGKNVKKFQYLDNDFVQLIDMVDTYRSILSNSLDVHLGVVSNNMNEVMKRLTIITSFILVPALIAGIYGMNFVARPEFELGRKGFYSVLGLMGLSIVLIYMFFKKMKWI